MKAGRELDALVAEKVMGLRVELYGGHLVEKVNPKIPKGNYPLDYLIPAYSTDIAAAWEVISKLHEDGFSYCIEQTENSEKPTVWLVKRDRSEEFTVARHGAERISESSDALPHAICLAALRALGFYELD